MLWIGNNKKIDSDDDDDDSIDDEREEETERMMHSILTCCWAPTLTSIDIGRAAVAAGRDDFYNKYTRISIDNTYQTMSKACIDT